MRVKPASGFVSKNIWFSTCVQNFHSITHPGGPYAIVKLYPLAVDDFD
jgi:hypothetical protein